MMENTCITWFQLATGFEGSLLEKKSGSQWLNSFIQYSMYILARSESLITGPWQWHLLLRQLEHPYGRAETI